MTYQQVLNIIKAALTGRPAGTKVQAKDHEAAEIAIVNYTKQLFDAFSGTVVREAHSNATAGVNCDLVWNAAFTDSNYSYIVNGFDADGNPVEIQKINKSSTKIVIRTLVNATMTAIAIPYQ